MRKQFVGDSAFFRSLVMQEITGSNNIFAHEADLTLSCIFTMKNMKGMKFFFFNIFMAFMVIITHSPLPGSKSNIRYSTFFTLFPFLTFSLSHFFL